MKHLLLWLINFYMLRISPLFPPRCRFYPSCSRYCFEAIKKHGIRYGLILSIKRIVRCHPFNEGGYDPLP
ncbi:MAG: membrane protein insertion efficiency factor YidD [Firmicutes bacterium]|nr:membrane protein insertion efficiency factor YidD [Bacillota bacterium]